MNSIKRFREIWHKLMYILTESQKRWGVVVFVVSLLGALLELLGVSVMLPLVQAMVNIDDLRNYSIVNKLCVLFNLDTSSKLIVAVIVGVILVYVIKNLFLCLVSWIRIKYAHKVQREISIHMLNSYVSRGYNFFRTHNSSVLLRGCKDSVIGVQISIFTFLKILSELLMIFCISVFLVITDWQMSIAMIFVAGACMLLVVGGFRSVIQRQGKVYYAKAATTNQWLLQLFSGIKESLVMNRNSFFVQNYSKSFIEQQRANAVYQFGQEAPAFMIEGICISGIMVAVGLKVITLDDVASYIPKLATFAVAAFRILPSVGKLASYFNTFTFNIPAIDETYENVKEAKEIVENSVIEEKTELKAEGDCTFVKGIFLENITYSYPDGERPVIENISIDIKRGESIALVGPSGAGKSTLADIILGLLLPQKGCVKMDDYDITQYREHWSNMIGFVPQSVYLMDDTIKKNIGFGLSEEQIDDEKVWRALEQAQMKAFVEELPNGMDTQIGDRGVRLSGGQAQRLAIARALYNNPEILVLDEATSALDNETESAVMSAIDSLQGQKTMIIIAHRLTTVKKCNKIYEVKNGTVVVKEYEEIV